MLCKQLSVSKVCIGTAYIAPEALQPEIVSRGPKAGPEPHSVNDITPITSPSHILRRIDAHGCLVG